MYAELNYDSAPQQEAEAGCLLSMQLVLLSQQKNLHCSVITSIDETHYVTIFTHCLHSHLSIASPLVPCELKSVSMSLRWPGSADEV